MQADRIVAGGHSVVSENIMGGIAAKATCPAVFMMSAAAFAININGLVHARAGSVGQPVGPRRRSCRVSRLRRTYPSAAAEYQQANGVGMPGRAIGLD